MAEPLSFGECQVVIGVGYGGGRMKLLCHSATFLILIPGKPRSVMTIFQKKEDKKRMSRKILIVLSSALFSYWKEEQREKAARKNIWMRKKFKKTGGSLSRKEKE